MPPKKTPCIDCGELSRGKRCLNCFHIYMKSEEFCNIQRERGRPSRNDPEVRKRISESVRAAHARGDYGEKWRRKLSETQKFAQNQPEVNRRRSKAVKAAHARGSHNGVYTSKEWLHKNSESTRAFWRNPIVRQRILKGMRKPEVRMRVSEAKRGKKNPQWRGGRAVLPYGPEFDEYLKKTIRERDNYQCAICGKPGKCVHHIDYDKKNNDPMNLITLCRSHHGKTITEDRDYWKNYFINSLQDN